MTPPPEHDDAQALSPDLIIWRLKALESGQRSHAEVLDRIERSLTAYKAVWKFALAVASGMAFLLGAVMKVFFK